ncbi:winged helix-turn-helix transcriptional regulator [Algoriphagus sp. 4150]
MTYKNKLLSKKAYPQIPPKVEYRLTTLGLKTLSIVDQLAQFGLKNLV